MCVSLSLLIQPSHVSEAPGAVADSTESGLDEVADPQLTAPQGHGDPLARVLREPPPYTRLAFALL